ncbi:MAG: Na+/H+ antiporter subunit A [Segniliparus sp.]|uniref:Na+/H+ antiporter subunit A n=1 Tax=Segniliparus sp. TaxID=2804064 RepID=UPI003F332B4A
MFDVLLAHGVAALLAPVLVARWGRQAFLGLALVPAASLAWVLAATGCGQTQLREHYTWIPQAALDVDLLLDPLGVLMCLPVLGVGAVVLVYCSRYFAPDEPKLGALAGQLTAFAGVMFGLIVSDNMLMLFTFWEITSVLSYLLVGHQGHKLVARRAALRALNITTLGGLAMLVGIIILGEQANSYLVSDVVRHPVGGVLGQVAIALVLTGAFTKSALIPWHLWLPGAMAAPTPVSAYLHAAAMVKAGVYLVCRFAPGYAHLAVWHWMVLPFGLATAFLGGWRALRAWDAKLVLAFSTISQLGLMTTFVGGESEESRVAGLVMLLAHSLFKAALFMTVGGVDRTAGTRHLPKLSHMGRRAAPLVLAGVLGGASMAALPPFLGFAGKDAAFSAVLAERAPLTSLVVLVLLEVGAAALTTGYSLRLSWGLYAHRKGAEPALRPAVALWAPPVLLGLLGIVATFSLPAWSPLLDAAAGGRGFRAEPAGPAPFAHLGAGAALVAVAVAIGCALFAANPGLPKSRRRLGNADEVYDEFMRLLSAFALRVTAFVQRGSLPIAQATTLTVLTVFPLAVLFLGSRSTIAWHAYDSPFQPVIAVVMVIGAVAAVVLTHRIGAVLASGITGYGCGVLFALHGAPDLALTQFLVETLTLVVFTLVLRKFDAHTNEPIPVLSHVARTVFSLGVGTGLAVLAMFAISARPGNAPILADSLARAGLERAHGKNTVNVIIVDIRAWDTFGEISVLLVAATGVASLVFVNRRYGTVPRLAADATSGSDQVSWLRSSEFTDPRQRSMILEIATRMVFPTIMALSVYFFFSGHNAPGGGFAGGLVAGLALVLRYLAGGRYELGETLPVEAGKILGAGLALTAATAAGSVFVGLPALSSASLAVDLPVLGTLRLNTASLFDLGVYLIVVGMVLDILRSLGARLDEGDPVGAPSKAGAEAHPSALAERTPA